MVNATRIVRIVAPNPSPMTLEGTNSYLLCNGSTAIAIDPGPAIDAHQAALVAAATDNGARITAIAVTHGHPDHAPGAVSLAARTGAPVYAHRNARFTHDRTLGDGERLDLGAQLIALDTPGHTDDHLAFVYEPGGALFSGDVVIGRGTVVIAPPHGDMRAYQATLRRLREDISGIRIIYGGHGEPIDDSRAKLDEYIAHRETRERQILDALADGERTIPQLVATIYRDVAPMLWPAAARQVLAYLLALEREDHVRSHVLDRALTADERAILDPDLSRIIDVASAAVAAAELGFDRDIDRIDAYARVGKKPHGPPLDRTTACINR